MDVYDSAEVFLRVKGGVVVDQYSKSNDDGMVFTVHHKDVNVVIGFKDVDEDGLFAGKQSFELCVFGIGAELLQSFGSPSSTIRCKIVIKTEEENSRCILHVDKTDFYLVDTDFTLSLTLKQGGGKTLSIKTCADSESGFLNQEGNIETTLFPLWQRRRAAESRRKVEDVKLTIQKDMPVSWYRDQLKSDRACEERYYKFALRSIVREMEEAKEKVDYDAHYSTIPQDKPEEWYQEQMKIATKQGNVARYRALMAAEHNIFMNVAYQKWEDLYDSPPPDDDEDNDDDDEDDAVARAPSSTLEDRMARVEERLGSYMDQLETRLNTMDGRIGTILSFIERITKNLPPLPVSRPTTPDAHLYVV